MAAEHVLSGPAARREDAPLLVSGKSHGHLQPAQTEPEGPPARVAPGLENLGFLLSHRLGVVVHLAWTDLDAAGIDIEPENLVGGTAMEIDRALMAFMK